MRGFTYFRLFALLLCLIMVLSSCTKKYNTPTSQTKPHVQSTVAKETSQNAEITVWTPNDSLESQVKKFQSVYPKIKVNVKTYDYNEYNNICIDALSSGTGPDVLFLESQFFGQYTVNGLLEDLSKEPYLAGKYEKDFPQDVWESNKSINGKSLLAMTFLRCPVITFYRADIMKENGFPSEPEEFGNFIEKPENLLALAKKLKAKDQYIFQWPTDLPNLVGSSVGIFDKDLHYIRNTDSIVKALDLAKQIHKAGFELEVGFWESAGKKAIQDSKLVMLFNLGSWGSVSIKNYAPEQSGKWRATRAPLGINGWYSDTKIAINSQSKNKEASWKFIEYLATQKDGGDNYYMINGYTPSRRNAQAMLKKEPFLGDQLIQPFYEDIADKMVQYKLTPLDGDALEIFWKKTSEATVKNIDSTTAVKNMTDEIEEKLSDAREILLRN